MAKLQIVKPYAAASNPDAKTFMVEDLARSGLKPEDMKCVPVEHPNYPGLPAYLIPYPHVKDYWRIRLDMPPDSAQGKYRGPANQPSEVYFPPNVLPTKWRRASIKYITEGEKKAAKLAKELDLPVCGIAGCWMWGHGKHGSRTLLPDLQNGLKPGDKVVYMADRDILTKPDIGKAAKALVIMLASIAVECEVIVPPDPYKAVDDWLADDDSANADSLDDLEAVDLSGSQWFPLDALLKAGVSFKPNKDGEILSYKQAISNLHNTYLLCQLLFSADPYIRKDKYAGYFIHDVASDSARIRHEIEAQLNQYFPEFKPNKDGIASFTQDYCNALGAGNCVRDYVAGLQWDDKPRLKNWLSKVVKLATTFDTEYADRVGKALICALYSRIMFPGCAQDFMFILIGAQGIGKTRFFRTLGHFPVHDGYTAVTAAQLQHVDTTLAGLLKRSVVVDIDDLEGIRRQDQGELKSFISRTHDNYRELYTHNVIDEPRGFIFTGSSNQLALLSDYTGNRRYLIVHVQDILKVAGPYSWSLSLRDQLLAECHANWAALDGNWWDIPIETVNANNAAFMWSDPIADAMVDMATEGKLLEINNKTYISAQAIARWMDDPKTTTIAVGMRLARMVGSANTSVHVLKRASVTLPEDLSDDMLRLYRPPNKQNILRVFQVKI